MTVTPGKGHVDELRNEGCMSIDCTNNFIKVGGNENPEVLCAVPLGKTGALQTKEQELWPVSRPTAWQVSVGV